MRGNTGVIVQARLGSARLPGKVLADVHGTSILERCLRRLTLSGVGRVVLATTDSGEDDALAAVASTLQVPVYRGSSADVLGRYLGAALTFGFDTVLRATADNPAVDIEAPRRLVRALSVEHADYVCEHGLPVGAAVEAFTLPALRRAAVQATASEAREHVTVHMRLHREQFQVRTLLAPPSLQRPDVRLTVDTAADLADVRHVFARTSSLEPSLAELIMAADALADERAA